MVRIEAKHAALYLAGVFLLVFGNREPWKKLQDANRQKEQNRRMAEEARIAATRPFEVQELVFDDATGAWKNPHSYFQTVHVGNVNFKALKPAKTTTVETNDDEDASDTF